MGNVSDENAATAIYCKELNATEYGRVDWRERERQREEIKLRRKRRVIVFLDNHMGSTFVVIII